MAKQKITRISVNLYDEIIKLQGRLKQDLNTDVSVVKTTDLLAEILRQKNITLGLNIETKTSKRKKDRFNFEL